MPPLYSYVCEACANAQEHLVRLDDRNNPVPCHCGGQMTREGLEVFAMGDPEYQMTGILSDGTKVPGHFAKDAKRRRKKQ